MEFRIDRIEGDFIVIECNGKTYSIPKILIENPVEGGVYSISFNKDKTDLEKKEIDNLVDDLFH